MHYQSTYSNSLLDLRLHLHLGDHKRKLTTDSDIILSQECDICKKERASKCRVAQSPVDFATHPFQAAPAIFPNNDVKYDANKSRAQKYANDNNLAVTYALAKVTPSHDALQEKPGISGEKLVWLQRHDRLPSISIHF